VDDSPIRCANGHVLPAGRAASRYCTVCGSPMLVTCPNGHLVKLGRFCTICGTALQPGELPQSATLADEAIDAGSDGGMPYAASVEDTEPTTPPGPAHVRSRRSRPVIAVITLLVLLLAGGVYFGVSKLASGPSSHSAVGAASSTHTSSFPPATSQAIQTAPAVTIPPAAPGPAAPSSLPPVSPTSAPPSSAAPAAVVSAYFAAINAGDYAQAWALGGDNIDLALAHTVAGDLAAKGTKIDAFQLQALWSNCRLAKEKLLDPESKADEVPVTILGRGSSLIGGTIKTKLRREQVEQVLEGFFPPAASTEMPQRARRIGLQEMGLPYASDAAITRHLARFLRQQASAGERDNVRRGASGLACPTHILFNGGVLNAQFVRDRILNVLNGWLAEEGFGAIQPLSGEDLMHAVSRGSAYYGAVRHGKGVRIRGGISRSYYVGIESAMPAVPGMAAPLKALAVAQFGMEEGTSQSIPDREFGLIVDEPAEFRFFCSALRKNDAPGMLIEDFGDDLEELSPVEVRLTNEGNSAEAIVPVSFETVITETGMLQLWCVARDGRRWKLEFNVRETV